MESKPNGIKMQECKSAEFTMSLIVNGEKYCTKVLRLQKMKRKLNYCLNFKTNTKLSVKSFLFYVLDLTITMNSRLPIIALIGVVLFSCDVTAGKITLNVNLIYDTDLHLIRFVVINNQ